LNQSEILKHWRRYCDSQGLQKEGEAVRLKLEWYEYKKMMDKNVYPDNILFLMQRIVEGREILDTTVLETSLYKEVEDHLKRCFGDKLMVTLAAPTGQGKTISAKRLAHIYGAKYYHALVDLQKPRVASVRGFIRDLSRAYNVVERSTNNLRHLINRLQSDTRQVLIIDESQRLISEDWGYFKVLQDLLDNVPTLSIILLGNYRFYNDMFTSPATTYLGISDQEQFLRRISTVQKLPRLTKSDVKLWADYNNIKLTPQDCQHLADYFSHRAALSDLENVRREMVRVMGKGRVKSWNDVNSNVLIAVYKRLHTELEFKEEGNAQNNSEAGAKTNAA